MANEIHEEELQEFVVFTDVNKDGKEIELAVVDEFEVEGQTYIAAAIVEGDEINTDGVFLYRANMSDDEFSAEKILDDEEYEKVCNAYVEA